MTREPRKKKGVEKAKIDKEFRRIAEKNPPQRSRTLRKARKNLVRTLPDSRH